MIDKYQQQMIILSLLVTIALVMTMNTYTMSLIANPTTVTTTGKATNPVTSFGVIPTGTPEIYGAEVGITYDDVDPYDAQRANGAIAKLSAFDRQITLSEEDMARYINVLYKLENGISCEYCCGARSVIFENGGSACGCAHSFAMRGVAKYLITKHGTEFTDEEILAEVGKWKVLFFPTQSEAKAEILKSQDIEPNYINLASNKYRGIEKGSGGAGGMVGGC